ncbi:metalloregulator ArsR/SmtB family transcription factor [Romboutsia sedimentorum]|uniref:Metalloregulator ArsR/SmtB family transcription factor n=1 Tax=Romboutsia sedimentorum TaxID=1368474 RepID=A0ABT7E574_9FIRM|nr:metalloregulator ArsR/SmtB family transcription factor [Romboutsia sedimentorum]MDK2562084.1 metalloregulator ArsR/SmtB family transcription factor [Romboutsia sedimentorum]
MELIQMLKALGDETRIRIVNILRKGSLCVCEIESILELTQSNASRHLNKLMNAKIVTYYKEAKYVYYKLDEETINKHSFIKELLDNELEKEEKLKYDYSILKDYKSAGLTCENVSRVKDIIDNVNKKKSTK